MSFSEEYRSFIVVYNNGEVYYFHINKKGEIYCDEFCKIFGDLIPGAHSIEFTETGFNLQDELGEEIYCLNDFRNQLKKFRKISFLMPKEITETEIVYMDEDVRNELVEKGKLKYTESASKIPGLLNNQTEEDAYTKIRHI